MDITSRVTAVYDQAAAQYAERNAVMPGVYLDLGPRFLALVGLEAVMLDLGCGAGRDLTWLTGQGARVIGGDRSAGMVAHAREHGARTLVQLDMRHLPFADDAFGGIWCSASLLHLPKADAPAALAEIRRVSVPASPFLLGIQEGTGEGWEASPYGPGERFFARYRPDEAEAMLVKAGFTIQERRTGVAPNRRWLTYLATQSD